MIKILAMFLISILPVTGVAQQVSPLSKREAAIKHKVDQLAPHAKITVARKDADMEFGDFVSCDRQTFRFYDIDRRVEVTLQYADVRKIKNGYGGFNSVQQRHTDRTKAVLIVVAVVGALGVLIGAAASARN